LEQLGLIEQPFTSAGRVPTDLGFRVFVDELMEKVPQTQQIQKQAIEHIHQMRFEEKVYDAVSLLARSCENVSFAILPGKAKTYYIGLANILRQPEFVEAARAYTVVKILEDTEHFVDLLQKLHIDRSIKVFIGRENVIPEIKSCSIIATTYVMPQYGSGLIGILGPMRMNYPFNMSALRYVRDNME
jgi:transcriptional regulator of heat shock response